MNLQEAFWYEEKVQDQELREPGSCLGSATV